MTWLYWLSQIAPSEKSLVGEKIFILSQLLQHGHPIVPGFVLESSLLTDFFANLPDEQSVMGHAKSLVDVDIDDYQVLQSLAQQNRQAVRLAEFPQAWQKIILDAIAQLNCSTVIIRPFLLLPNASNEINNSLLRSRSASLLRSQITGVNADSLIWGIKKVWSELFSAKNILVCHKLQIQLSQVKLTLLIQPFHNAQASGSISLDKERIYLRAIWGLRHGLDYGAVPPDTYLLNRQQSNLIEQQLGNQTISYQLKKSLDNLATEKDYLVTDVLEESGQETAVLNDEHIRLLVELVNKITIENPEIEYLEWSMPQVIAEQPADSIFYFEQPGFAIPNSAHNDRGLLAKKTSQLLSTGIGAAPGKVTGQVFVYQSENSDRALIKAGSILVINNLAPSEIPLLKNLGGIITETGSLTSHAAILARELGIPAIVKSKDAATILQTGDSVTIDGTQGTIYAENSMSSELNSQDDYQENSPTLGIFDYPIATKLMVNFSQEKLLEDVASLPIDGIGLLRSDLLLLELLNDQTLEQWWQESSQSQIVEQLVSYIRNFALKFAPRPIFYRSLDIPFSHNQYFNLDNRGAAAYLKDPSFFDLELSALARLITEGVNNINLILPFVRTVEEFRFCRDRFLARGLANSNSCQLWIMAEVPSVLFLLPEYIKAGVQGFAIGTGDLTRLLLGLDREQIDLNKYSDDAALQNAIAQIISLTKNQQIPCSICLHGTEINPNLIENLINWGITSITVEPQAIKSTYRAIARIERRLLLTDIQRENYQ